MTKSGLVGVRGGGARFTWDGICPGIVPGAVEKALCGCRKGLPSEPSSPFLLSGLGMAGPEDGKGGLRGGGWGA